MKKLLMASLIWFAAVATAQANIISQWDFNRDAAGNLPNATSPSPSTGSGSASLFGGVEATGTGYASGTVNGGSSDPSTISFGNPGGNNGWQVNAGWDPTGASFSQGVQFLVDTTGLIDDVTISWDLRQSNSSSRFSGFQYTIDGNTWLTLMDPGRITVGTNPLDDGDGSVTAGGLLGRTFGDRWLNVNAVDLSGLGAGDNSLFGFRILAAHDPEGSTFVRSDNGVAGISATGTWRFDMVTVRASAIPEPSSMVLLMLSTLCGSLIRFRSRS